MPISATAPSVTRTHRMPAGGLAYTDVGQGPPVVFLHGNPTSARLYRHLIRDLVRDYRCIAPDHLGFGRSDAPPDASYRPPAHATRLEILLRKLDLTNVTLVLHDWGGPIGLAYALRHPETVQRLVLMNTWGWPLVHRPLLQGVSRLLGTPHGRLTVEQANAFAHLIMPATTGPAEAPYPEWIQAYAASLDTRPRRYACWALARSLHTETTWLRTLWTHRHRLPDRPLLLCWGMADPAFGRETCLRRWDALSSTSTLYRFWEKGHYLPEEMGPALVSPVRSFLETTP